MTYESVKKYFSGERKMPAIVKELAESIIKANEIKAKILNAKS
jgi:hypothetical protein